MRNTLDEREFDKFVESPTRSGKTAVEVLVANDINVNLDGIASQEKQDEQTAELQSIKSELQTLNGNDFSTFAEQQNQSTILTNIYNALGSIFLKLGDILNAITGVLNIRNLTFANDKVDTTGSSVSVNNFPATQNVNVVSSVLPTGAATAANQTTANSILSNILTAIQGVLNIRNLVFATDKVDVSGSSITTERKKLNTYSASEIGFVAANTATDIFTISGSATKKIRVTHISINGVQQNISSVLFLLIKRSTLNAGGTSTIKTNIPHSSLNPAATAVVRSYTANPTTLGNQVGVLMVERVVMGSNGANAISDNLSFKFGDNDQQEIILENENESLCVNLNGVTLSGNTISIDASWIEV